VISGALQAVAAAVAIACGIREPPRPTAAVDWPEFVRLVDRHRVAPLVERSRWLEGADAPPSARSAVAERARRDTLASLRVLALQREVLEALAAAGIEALVLKGVPLAIDAYGNSTARAPGDIDLLVSPASIEPAVAALESAGFSWYGWRRPEDPDRPPVERTAVERFSRLPMLRDVTLARGSLHVEVHWRLFPNPRLMPVDPAWLSAPRRVDVQGAELSTLPLEAQWLYLLVHGTNHLWPLMKWLADVPAFALRRPEVAHREALERVPAGYRRSVATGLLVAEATFGRFLTAEGRAWASSVRGTRVLVTRSLSALRADHDRPKRVSPRALPAEVLGRLALRPDAGYRLAELRLLLLSAGRAHGVEDPGLRDVLAGPLRWTRRSARRFTRVRRR
jgi:Uncharacterised nucleotidyltransferase